MCHKARGLLKASASAMVRLRWCRRPEPNSVMSGELRGVAVGVRRNADLSLVARVHWNALPRERFACGSNRNTRNVVCVSCRKLWARDRTPARRRTGRGHSSSATNPRAQRLARPAIQQRMSPVASLATVTTSASSRRPAGGKGGSWCGVAPPGQTSRFGTRPADMLAFAEGIAHADYKRRT